MPVHQAPNSSRRVEEFTALAINLQPLSDPNNIGDRQPGADFIPVFSEVQEDYAYRLTEAFLDDGTPSETRTPDLLIKSQ